MPLISHPSALPALDLQVAPQSRTSMQRLPTRLWVAPHASSSGSAGVRSSGCPESRLLSALPAVFKLQVSLQLYFARRASRCITGFPGLCIFRPCRRPIIGLPQLSCPSAPPARQLRVSPQPRSSSCACRCILQVAPVPASSGFAGNGSSSYPESLVLRRLRCLSSRSPANSAPPGCSSWCRCGFPHRLHLPAWPRV